MSKKTRLHTSPQSNHRFPDAPPRGFDPRLARIFRQADRHYDLLDDGTYVIQVSLPEGHTRAILVNSKTDQVGTRELRHLFAWAFTLNDLLPAVLANQLLLENSTTIGTAWQIVNNGDSLIVLLAACLPANAESTDLLDTVNEIALSADQMARQFSADESF